MMTLCLCASTALFAADGTWNNAAGGAWETAGNWTGNTIADGAGNTATFDTDSANIDADANRTIGNISKSAAADLWISTGPLVLDDGTPQVDVTVGGLYLNCALAGSSGFDKTGAGNLGLYNTTISGDINVNAGGLWLFWADAIMNADVKINSGTTLFLWDGVVANGQSITVNNGGQIRPWDGTVGINAPLTLNYADAGNTFAVEAVGADDIINLNGDITLAANTALAVTDNGATININAPISGPYSLRLMGRSATAQLGTYNINAPCTYTGWTTLESWGANPRYEIGVNQAFPVGGFDTELRLQVDNSSADTSVTLDMNDKTQKVSKLVVVLDGAQTGHSAEIAGSAAGVIEVTNVFWSTASAGTTLSLTGGKVIFNGPGLSLNMPLTIANATFLNNGSWWSGTTAKFIMQSGGKIGGTGMLAWDGGDSTNLVITAGATITPGQSIGEVGCWNLEMLDGSLYDWEVGDTTADKVYARGVLDISDGGITVNVIDAGSPNGTFTLFQADGGIIGDATDITMSYGPGVAGPVNPTIDGNAIVADIVPEPAALGMLVLLGLAFLRRK